MNDKTVSVTLLVYRDVRVQKARHDVKNKRCALDLLSQLYDRNKSPRVLQEICNTHDEYLKAWSNYETLKCQVREEYERKHHASKAS